MSPQYLSIYVITAFHPGLSNYKKIFRFTLCRDLKQFVKRFPLFESQIQPLGSITQVLQVAGKKKLFQFFSKIFSEPLTGFT